MEARKPTFDLVVTNPDIVTGPMIHPVSDWSSVNSTNIIFVGSFVGGTPVAGRGPKTWRLYHFADVRDVARAHVEALTNPAAASRRILLVGGLITPQLVRNAIRERLPELRERVAEGTPSQVLPPGLHPNGFDLSASLDILDKGAKGGKWEFRDLETTVGDTVRSMIEHGLV